MPSARLLIATLSAFCALLALPGASGAARAHAARTVNLSEYARLHRTSSGGVHLNEQGYATGTINGTIYLHLKISEHHVSAEVSIYPHGGSLTATGTASYHVNGGYAPFSGTLTVQRGTGTYAHAQSGSLRFTGSIQRSNDAVTVQLSGRLSY
ncbi:MAG: autotransporter [Actinomycetota bacterium]|nr:autotransporter [Actinomycetota bacterium]